MDSPGGLDEYFPDTSGEFENPPEYFASREALETYVRGVAAQRNITLSVRNSSMSNVAKPKFVNFECTFGGEYRRRKSTGTRKTTTLKAGCPFSLTGKEWIAGQGPWYIQVKDGRHNHPFPLVAEGSRVGKITPQQKAVIREQEKVNLPPSGMLSVMKSTDESNATTKKQVNNAVAAIRRESRQGRSPLQNFFHNLDAYGYRFDVRRRGDSNEVGDIVFSHPASYWMLNTYPEVMMIDCTYSTNRHDMPLLEAVGATSTDKTFTIAYAFMVREETNNYLFVLQFIRSLYNGGHAPNVVVTDRAYALLNAARIVFPESRHHLCRRHIEQCILKQVIGQPGFSNDFAELFKYDWNWAISAKSRPEFDTRWQVLEQRYSRFRALLRYCITTWVGPHGDNICSYSQDYYLHYGSYTTNR